MKTRNVFGGIAATLVLLLSGCAQDPENEYLTEHNPKYAITYLLTEFESGTHRNAEGVDRDGQPMGYHYTFGDPKSLVDYIEPYPKESEFCRTQTIAEFYETLDTSALLEAIQNNDTDAERRPYPPRCSLITGLRNHHTKPFPHFGSRTSFHMKGVSAGDGVGFGTYFSDYMFYENPDPETGGKTLRRDANGNLPATFSDGREDTAGNPVCDDDALFAGTIDSAFNANATPYLASHKNDNSGKYGVTGSVFTSGNIWRDTDGVEHYELDHAHTEKLKEPRCLSDMGQQGFVMWAMGNTAVEVAFNVPETSPLSDGGMCDEDAGEKCYDFHRVRFELDGEWREYHASFDAFIQNGWGKPVPLNPNHIINIQIKVLPTGSGAPKPFDVWLDHIGFYGGDTWDFTRRMSDTNMIYLDTESVPNTAQSIVGHQVR